MKNKKIICLSVILILLIPFLFTYVIRSDDVGVKTPIEDFKLSQEEPRYIEVFESIYIDGNFSDVVNLYNWASGSGDIFDPYTIQAISMINNTLSIKNTEFFTVKDSSFFNYSQPYGHHVFAGLSIGNSSFGIIQNNIFTNCSNGISLYGNTTEDIQILQNYFYGSHDDNYTGFGKAIYIHDAISVIIDNNAIISYYDGICVRNAGKIYIVNNRIETIFDHISDTGIYFYGVVNSSIIDNNFFGCIFAGHDYENPYTSGMDGLKTSFDNCFNITVYGNKFYDLDGILIGGSEELEEPDELIISIYFYLISISILIGTFIIFIFTCVYYLFKKNKENGDINE